MSKLPNTIFNRVNILKVKIKKFNMKHVGQLVRKAYVAKAGKEAEKISMILENAKKEPTVRFIAVYPDDFVKEMDLIITKYAAANKPKRKRIYKKHSDSNPFKTR